MKLISKLLVAITLLLSVTLTNAQIKNSITETVKISGNCGMCEEKIEKAGNLKKIAKVDWNKDTSMAKLTYDSKKTNQDEILKRIALAGYDSEKFLAPDEVYNNLHGCCQYERVGKTETKTEEKSIQKMNMSDNVKTIDNQEVNQLNDIYENYFAVKDALVKTDGIAAAANAKTLLSTINSVKMDALKMDVHMVWMKVLENLKQDVTAIAATSDAKKQRDSFDTLSLSIYELIKISKTETPTYYQFCPMANDGKGANWLSKENTIKNPYFGSMMLSCGKTVETIK
ncbi:DUF3347 domain-containing protein [Flavobacterium sp.]|uniref:DUF3347 domain-containing protein n=1 Tax=Flavobacterium sp. TaxID=239 RepID=UPI0037519886